MDANKDGKISWDEMFGGEADEADWPEDIKKEYSATFKDCDKDQDGLISREELPTLFDKLTAMEDMEEEREGNDEI